MDSNRTEESKLRVCYFGTYDPEYPRNRIVIDGLRASGAEVAECNMPFWGATEERVCRASGGWLSARFLWRLARCYVSLLRKELSIPDYDVMLVGYPGQLDVYLARALSSRRRKPLVFDVLMSLSLILEERGIAASSPLTARLAYWLERGACRLVDCIILDTAPYRDYFCRKYHLSPDVFRLAPLGADERVYHPLARPRGDLTTFKVVYHGRFVPLHGVEVIVEAARILRGCRGIQFEFIGEGTTKQEALTMVARYSLQNVSFVGWIDKDQISRHLSDADLCLGVFGTTQQAFYTVPNKIWEGLAMRRAVITGDTPAVRDVLTHGQHVYLCKPGSPGSLASAVLTLYDDPDLRERLARQGCEYWQQNFTMEKTGAKFYQYLIDIVAQRATGTADCTTYEGVHSGGP